MNLEEIQDKMISILGTYCKVPRDSILMDKTFVDLDMSDLDIVEFVIDLEDNFKIDVPEDDLSHWEKVGDTLKYLKMVLGIE